MPSPSQLDACVILLCLSLSAFLARWHHRKKSEYRPRAYILRNQVTHARHLPSAAAHAFNYPTLAFLFSLDALERHELDLARGWVFGYGGIFGRIVGIRPRPYLGEEPISIQRKMEKLLQSRGFFDGGRVLKDAWMLTMPALLGWEGPNPLTVYFCYDTDGEFWLTVLEIHNTFGETHVHVLEIGTNEETPSKGYDHQWTFPREFHVSPFNDRGGFYKISIKTPAHPPMLASSGSLPPNPRPSVRVHYYTNHPDGLQSPGQLKLTALLRPERSDPLSIHSVLQAIAQYPFALVLATPRTLYVAWILHYKKRLDVFLRPEPLPATAAWIDNRPDLKSRSFVNGRPGGVRWNAEGLLERFARRRVEAYLKRRVDEVNITVTFIPADPSTPHAVFAPSILPEVGCPALQLSISYLSSRVFNILFLSPSAECALLLGCDAEKLFNVSSRDIFLQLFSPRIADVGPTPAQKLRTRPLPPSLLGRLKTPDTHFLDVSRSLFVLVGDALVILLHQFLDKVEQSIFEMARARVVVGQEPWLQWQRAEQALNARDSIVTFQPTLEMNVIGVSFESNLRRATYSSRPLLL